MIEPQYLTVAIEFRFTRQRRRVIMYRTYLVGSGYQILKSCRRFDSRLLHTNVLALFTIAVSSVVKQQRPTQKRRSISPQPEEDRSTPLAQAPRRYPRIPARRLAHRYAVVPMERGTYHFPP